MNSFRIAYVLITCCRYSDKDPLVLDFQSPCDHKCRVFKCITLTLNEIISNRRHLYTNVGKNAQDTYLSRFIAPYPVKRKRQRENSTTPRPNEFSVSYYLLRDS